MGGRLGPSTCYVGCSIFPSIPIQDWTNDPQLREWRESFEIMIQACESEILVNDPTIRSVE